MKLWKDKNRKGLGLDIGTGSIKAVELSWSSQDGVSIIAQKQSRLRAEGILDEEELSHSLSGWLEQSGWKDSDICVGLPQYLSTVQVRDFPATVDDKLKDMIAYETVQLSGISEESFIHDYHVMPPKFARKNPVLIGISRYSVVSDKLKVLQGAGVLPTDMTMNSMAVMNALFALRPETRAADALQMIVEIGAENSMIIIFAGGQILSINSLLFGAEKYTKAISESLGLDLAKAEEEKQRIKIDHREKNNPLCQISVGIVVEIKAAIEQWRIHESEDFSETDFVKIWLCGGGVLTDGLQDFVKSNFRRSQLEVFGPKDDTGRMSPEFVTAYGLALQALGESDIKISLTPPDIRWIARKKKNFHLLSAALFFIVASVFIIMASHFFSLKMQERLNRKVIQRLKKCDELIPQIEKLSEEIRHHEKMVLPFVAKGNNVPKILSAINEIAGALDEDILMVYLGDEENYYGLRGRKNVKGQVSNSFFDASKAKISTDSLGVAQTIPICVDKIVETNSIIIYGFTISIGKNEHYEMVRKLRDKLSKSNLFGGNGEDVDIIAEDEKIGREGIVSEWMARVVNNKDVYSALGRKRFREFAIRIPFEETCINPIMGGNEGGGHSK
jgi:type IV pilus assembly protein PilM